MALGAQVMHVATYSDPPQGTHIYTVFTKECQKRSKRGVPPVFDPFSGRLRAPGYPPPPDDPSEGQNGLTLPSR